MVLDLNKCLGCHTCTVACKKLWNTDQGTDYAYWNSVETMPGKGYPAQYAESGGRTANGEVKRGRVPNMDAEYGRAWTFNHSEVIATDAASGTKEWLRPNEKPKWGPNWDEDHGEGSYPQDNHYFYLPRLCNHCTHPACLDACPRRLRSTSARRTASCWWTRTAATATASASRPAPTRRSTSTTSARSREVHLLPAARRGRRGAGLRAAVPGAAALRRLPR